MAWPNLRFPNEATVQTSLGLLFVYRYLPTTAKFSGWWLPKRMSEIMASTLKKNVTKWNSQEENALATSKGTGITITSENRHQHPDRCFRDSYRILKQPWLINVAIWSRMGAGLVVCQWILSRGQYHFSWFNCAGPPCPLQMKSRLSFVFFRLVMTARSPAICVAPAE